MNALMCGETIPGDTLERILNWRVELNVCRNALSKLAIV